VQYALPEGDAVGRFDLMSVVAHELGHVLGFEHGAGDATASFMDETLDVGVRLLPSEMDAPVEEGELSTSVQALTVLAARDYAAWYQVEFGSLFEEIDLDDDDDADTDEVDPFAPRTDDFEDWLLIDVDDDGGDDE